jgi:hypothetical protein
VTARVAVRTRTRSALLTGDVRGALRLALLLLGLFGASGHAAMGSIPLTALVDRAELIVLGRIESVSAVPIALRAAVLPDKLSEAAYLPASVAELSVASILKGPSGLRRIQIAFTRQEDSPRYRPGETVIVFLSRVVPGDPYTTVGLLQGCYRITNDEVEREQAPVAEFMARISRLVREAGGLSDH